MNEQSKHNRVSFQKNTVAHSNKAVLDEADLSKLWYSEEDCRRADFRNRLTVDMVKMGGPLPAYDQECFRGLESLFHHAIQEKVSKSQEAVFNAQRKNKSVVDAYAPFSEESSRDARRLGERDAEEVRRLNDPREFRGSHRSLPSLKPPTAGPPTKIKKFFNLFRRKHKKKRRAMYAD